MERLEQKGEESTHLFFLAQSEKIVAFKRPKPGNLERVGKKKTEWMVEINGDFISCFTPKIFIKDLL